MSTPSSKPRVAVIGTGGTISSISFDSLDVIDYPDVGRKIKPGEIVERKINKGQVVQPADALFTVADLGSLWAVSEIPESNSYLIHKGQKVILIIRKVTKKARLKVLPLIYNELNH